MVGFRRQGRTARGELLQGDRGEWRTAEEENQEWAGLFPRGMGVVGGLCLGLGGGLRVNGHGWLLLHECVHQEAYTKEYERDGEELAHVEGHVGLEVYLVVLYKLNEEAAPEAHNEEYADERTPVQFLQPVTVQPDKEESKEEIGKSLV